MMAMVFPAGAIHPALTLLPSEVLTMLSEAKKLGRLTPRERYESPVA
jgi:hypothetical protein